MKFLCEHCKAKYQIADEKVAGRTLRMKCRRCAQDIIIRASAASRASSAPPVSGAEAAESQSRLGSEFQRQIRQAPSVPAPPKLSSQWHVAINDVPVGPVSREELAHKIATGAVDETSLVWREGFDDWRPLGDVEQLVNLLRRRPTPPPIPAPGFTASSTARHAVPGSGLRDTFPSESGPDVLPSSGSNASIVPSVPPAESATRTRLRVAVSVPVSMLMMGVMVFAVALAVLTSRMFSDSQGADTVSAAAPKDTQPMDPGPGHDEPLAEPGEEEVAESLEMEAIEIPESESEQPQLRPKPGRTAGAKASSKQDGLSDTERRLLARMGGGSEIADIEVGEGGGRQRGAGGTGLTAQQLQRAVSRNQPALQRCYNMAIRGITDVPAVRMDVSLTVGASGKVSSVGVRGGNELPGLSRCIEQAVRLWTFPPSGAASRTGFPIVFAAPG